MNFWRDEPPLPNRISLISRRTWNGGNGQECRVVIEGGRVGVWVAEGRTVRQVDYAVVDAITRQGRGWRIQVDGQMGSARYVSEWDVVQGGCACGSVLKYHEPSVTEAVDAEVS